MTAETGSALEMELSATGTTSKRVSPQEAPRAISEAVTTPAVGVALNRIGVSLSETPVVVDPTPNQVSEARTGVTPASLAISDYGTLVLAGHGDGSELVSLFVERHIAVLRESDVVEDMETTFGRLGSAISGEFGDAILETGPSATADMGALVTGAHGPREVHAILVTEG